MASIPIADLWQTIVRWPRRRRTLLVGIDGPGGSGKSTLAAALARHSPEAAVVHMDDFYVPSAEQAPLPHLDGEGFDWQRLQAQVLAPLGRDEPAHYQRYDWNRDQIAEWLTVEPTGVVLVEGVCTTRRELRGYYDLRIFVECPPALRLERGLARDGAAARTLWTSQWMPAEDRYFERHDPRSSAHAIIDGTGEPGSSASEQVTITWTGI